MMTTILLEIFFPKYFLMPLFTSTQSTLLVCLMGNPIVAFITSPAVP